MMKRVVAWMLMLALLLMPLACGANALKASMTLVPAKMVLYVGADGVGSSQALAPVVSPEALKDTLTFTSSKPEVATVDEAGVVTAVKSGTAVITCKTSGLASLKRTCRVTVKPQPPTSLTLSENNVTMTPGARHQIDCTIEPANAVNQQVVWKSSKTAVAKVSASGLITAVKPGTALITCKTRAGGLKQSVAVTVSYENADIYYLSIGQINYQHVNPLESSLDDAKRFEAMLKSGSFGQKSLQGELVYDLTKDQLVSKLSSLPALGMDENDITYLYYSGHGAGRESQKSVRGALVGVDYKSGKGYVTVDEVRTYLDRVPGTVVVVLDCCLSGQYITAKGARRALVNPAQAEATLEAMVDAFKGAPKARAKGINSLISGNPYQDKYRIIAACKPLEDSWALIDKIAYSLFTRYLGESVGIMGAQSGSIIDTHTLPADKNHDGYVSLTEIMKYAAPKVLKMALKEAYTAQNMMIWPTTGDYAVFARLG